MSENIVYNGLLALSAAIHRRDAASKYLGEFEECFQVAKEEIPEGEPLYVSIQNSNEGRQFVLALQKSITSRGERAISSGITENLMKQGELLEKNAKEMASEFVDSNYSGDLQLKERLAHELDVLGGTIKNIASDVIQEGFHIHLEPKNREPAR